MFNSAQLLLTIVFMTASFTIGSLWTKVQYLEKSSSVVKGVTTTPNTQGPGQQATPPQALPTEDTSPKQVSIDNDPVLGDKNAPITLIDFTDYECPFCRRHFEQTYSQLIKDYIDTGKVKMVVRDLPLNFHENAHKEAQAAECAREQGGDTAYFKFHDEIFKRTTSNGTGLSLDQLPVIAQEVGLDGDALQSCLDSEKYKDEVDKDLADATAAEATGTPTFFLGKSTSEGVITGTKIVGAQPYSVFQSEIDKLLE